MSVRFPTVSLRVISTERCCSQTHCLIRQQLWRSHLRIQVGPWLRIRPVDYISYSRARPAAVLARRGFASEHNPQKQSSQTGSDSGTAHDAKPPPPRDHRLLNKLLVRTFQLLIAWNIFYALTEHTRLGNLLLALRTGQPLNTDTFTPFAVLAREEVSPTSFVLTVRPARARSLEGVRVMREANASLLAPFRFPPALLRCHASGDALRSAWEHGVWSVEVKQPLLQVAREYTPLPPQGGAKAEVDELEQGDLRFLVRTVTGGEVSAYLAGLQVGDQIELRGPHLGFDVRTRLGGEEKVVFLAGGTGVAPAMQVVRTLLDVGSEVSLAGSEGPGDNEVTADGPSWAHLRDQRHSESVPPLHGPRVSIVWANRTRADCAGCDAIATTMSGVWRQELRENPIVEQLRDMQSRHCGRLSVRCMVDEENSFIDAKKIVEAAGLPENTSTSARWKSSTPTNGITSPASHESCQYHSQRAVAHSSDHDQVDGRCGCQESINSRGTGRGGKHLVIVSGPDGFVEAYAGAKIWESGQQLQGPVRGLLGHMRESYPEFRDKWIVLKL